MKESEKGAAKGKCQGQYDFLSKNYVQILPFARAGTSRALINWKTSTCKFPNGR